MTTFKTAALDETEAEFRQFLAYLFVQSSPGRAVTGVLAGLNVSQTTTASGSVLVAFGAALQQTSVSTGVSPLISNTTSTTLDVLGASPMGGLPRNDLIVFDSVTASFAVVVGTPNASPTDPTPPNPSVPLARLRHAASATTIPSSKIDDLRVFTYLAPTAVDTGWVNCSVASGKAGKDGGVPQVRREGKRISIRWGWANTGLTGTNTAVVAGTVPQYAADGVTTLRPPRAVYINVVGSTGNQRAMAVIDSNGTITIRIGASACDYYLFPGELDGWWVD